MEVFGYKYAILLAAFGLSLSGCGPVLLGEEVPRDAAAGPRNTGEPPARALDTDAAAGADVGEGPSLHVSVRPAACGRCFELEASGSGGEPPYQFEWSDGARDAQREVCVASELRLSVVARDAAGGRSSEQSLLLQPLMDATCSQPPEPARFCLSNMSFEGTASRDLGAFDAKPWSPCINSGDGSVNAVFVGNETLVSWKNAPRATDGLTYAAIGENAQLSQPFCSALDTSAKFSFEIDLANVDLSGGGLPEGQVFLEVWGGLSVDCSRRELLWASPALSPTWKRYCGTFRPHSYMDQIVLRASSGMTQIGQSFVIVDDMAEVDSCP